MIVHHLTVEHPAGNRPLLANNRLHHMAKAKHTRAWRAAATDAATAAAVPPFDAIDIDVWGRYPTRQVPDADGIAPTVKAVIDGLVDAGVIPDDKPPHLWTLRYWPPIVTRKAPPAVMLTITARTTDRHPGEPVAA